jgi:hypothetical protein
MDIPITINIQENSVVARVAAWKLKSSAVAMVFGNTIYLYGVTKDEFLRHDKWVKHELLHVAQYRRFGKTGFLWRYFVEWIKHGYYNNRFEIEAREAENLPVTVLA